MFDNQPPAEVMVTGSILFSSNSLSYEMVSMAILNVPHGQTNLFIHFLYHMTLLLFSG